MAFVASLVMVVPLIAAAAPASGAVVINEVETEGVDFVELYNTDAAPVGIGGYEIDDETNSGGRFTIPDGTTIPGNGFYFANDPVNLGSADAARLFPHNATDIPLDSYAWTSHPATTYGRCPDGTGAFVVTNSPTPGAANACPVIEKCVVPRIAKGRSRARVRTKLTAAGCKLGSVTKRFSRRVNRGKLIRLKVKAGTERPAGAKVGAVFSKGKPPS